MWVGKYLSQSLCLYENIYVLRERERKRDR